MTHITIIAALDEGRGIGNRLGMPWHLPADFAHFRRVTMGKTLLMGRSTFESIGAPLPGRDTVVLTSNKWWNHPGVRVAHTLEEGLVGDEVIIAGGAKLYGQTIPLANEMILSWVDGTHEVDTYFPRVDWSPWRQVEEHPFEGFTVRRYLRGDHV